MKIRYFLMALVLFVLTMIRVQTADASWLGAPDGTYDITITIGSGHDAQGTLTFTGGAITAFDVTDQDGAQWMCDTSNCPTDPFSFDIVNLNDSTGFSITDAGLPGMTGFTLAFGSLFTTTVNCGTVSTFSVVEFDGPNCGTFTLSPVSRVPEPNSLLLLTVGLSGVGMLVHRWSRG
jgi:hypothetical protein